MAFRIQLKNSEKYAYLDEQVYHSLNNDKELAQYGFLINLREHSSGCAVFQKTKRKQDGHGFEVVTIYLHKLIAERFLADQKSTSNNLVGCKNGNKLDCRLENLEYRSRSTASRKRKSSSKLGYTGVYQENNRYRAVISINRKSVHIGMFATPEEAAEAYNKKSKELYGDLGKINIIRPHAARGDGGGLAGLEAGKGASETNLHRDSLRRREKED